MRTILKSTGSFWLDAIRDFVVVIASILAALWLESWWQDRLEREEEQQILTDLRDEFVATREELVRSMRIWERMAEYQVEIHSLMGPDVTPEKIRRFEELHRFTQTRPEQRDNTERGTFVGMFFDPKYGQLTSVISSGKLGLIESSELRALLAGWPALVADLDFERRQLGETFTHGVGPIQRELGTGWADSAFEPRTEELMMSRRYDNELANFSSLLRRKWAEAEVILVSTDDQHTQIIERINEELGE